MDAFVALGAAINIAQAIDYGLRLLQKSKDLRERGVTDPTLEDDAQRLNNLANSLTSQDLSKSAGDLRDLAVECADVSKILISELEQLKPADPTSKVQRAKAIWKREHQSSRIMELERRLQDHKSQLVLHLTSLSRIEFNDKLDEVSLDMQKIKSELAAMHLVAKELSNSDHVGQEISRALQPLVQQYYDGVCQSSELAILDMLHFPDMHERFDTIPDAHKATLHWLFDPPGHDQSTRGKAGNNFVAWLRQGSGFFHISGKPGSGKSTLMKYVCSHQDLDDHLRVWCQDARLGCGQFFFWKPGSQAQKSIKGLLRGLLHSILDKNRNLISTVLPDLWKVMFSRSSSSRQLEYRDFQLGFDNLLTYARDTGAYKFALFIDGLDEFEGQHLDLITTMKGWTEKYPIKICVSSREYGVFLQSLISYPKLRLHECNFVDIERMASARLKSSSLCADLLKSEEELQTIVELIKTRADGVFIWVSAVLAGIEDAIISGADLSELKERIDAYPGELDDLYWHLIHLIHEKDRKWAFRALKMVQFAQPYHDLVWDRFAWKISLLQLSFLDDIQYDATAGFPKAPALYPKKAMQRLDNTYKKVYGRCKGLLDVIKVRNKFTPCAMEQQVAFTHRSLVEFLDTPSFVEKARPYISNTDSSIDVFGTMLRCLEYQQPVPDVFHPKMIRKTNFDLQFISTFWTITIDTYLRLACKLRPVMPNLFLHCLEAFRDHIVELSRRVEDEQSLASWTIQYFGLVGLHFGVAEPWKRVRDNFSPLAYNKSLGFFVYMSFKSFLDDNFGSRGSNITQDQCIEVLDCFICLGASFNSKVFYDPGGFTMWRRIILKFMTGLFPQSWRPGIVIDWCLRHGAEPDLTIGHLVSDCSYPFEWLMSNGGRQGVGRSTCSSSYEQPVLLMKETSPLCQIIKENSHVLELRDLLSYWFPGDEYFPSLIDRLQSGEPGRHFEPTLSPTVVGGPPGKIARRTWEIDYKSYRLRDFDISLGGKGISAIDLDKRLVFRYPAP